MPKGFIFLSERKLWPVNGLMRYINLSEVYHYSNMFGNEDEEMFKSYGFSNYSVMKIDPQKLL